MDPSSPAANTSLLTTSLRFVQGVGPDRAALLERLQLHTVSDVLFFLPRDYLDLTQQQTIDELVANQPANVVGCVVEIEQRTTQSGKLILGVLLQQGSDWLRGLWFNQPFMRDRFRTGQTVAFSGKPRRNGTRWEMAHPRVQFLEPGQAATRELRPVYKLTDGLSQRQMHRIVSAVVEKYAGCVPEVFPEAFLQKKNLSSIQQALHDIHAPTDHAAIERARRRFVYQELLVQQLGLALRQQQLVSRHRARPLPTSTRIDARIRRLFPFELTADQDLAVQQIGADLGRAIPMNRLLQGDVGSGKTAVAAYAMLLAVAHGTQAALLAPTEVLAAQHFDTLQRLLSRSQVRLGFLSGSLTPRQRDETQQNLAEGKIDIVVGTHAILQQGSAFQTLALVVIDEQHKFGVLQRASLRQSDVDPHCLIMTATPIPRTIAMTLFGDLDVSVLRNSPPGRQPVHTYLAAEEQRGRWWDFFRQKLREGRQGYVISPLVDDADQETISAEAALEHLANGELADFRLDLLHGRLSADEKLTALRQFQAGHTQVLVATSVVEVGIDVPNANLMTIEHGERFGLAQLHQLRGRVSRGTFAGYVCVFAQPQQDQAVQRLQAFVDVSDGFELAEIDFQLRGPGDLFGTRQHGLPALRVADLRRDADLLAEARQDAHDLLAHDPQLDNPDVARLKRSVMTRYGQVLELGDVG